MKLLKIILLLVILMDVKSVLAQTCPAVPVNWIISSDYSNTGETYTYDFDVTSNNSLGVIAGKYFLSPIFYFSSGTLQPFPYNPSIDWTGYLIGFEPSTGTYWGNVTFPYTGTFYTSVIKAAKFDNSDNSIVFAGEFDGIYSNNSYFTNPFGGGNIQLNPSDSIFISKINSQGQPLWTHILNSNNNYTYNSITFRKMIIDDSGNIIIGGSFGGTNIDFDPTAGFDLKSSSLTGSAFISKYSSSGSYVGTYIFNYGYINKITAEVSGDIIVDAIIEPNYATSISYPNYGAVSIPNNNYTKHIIYLYPTLTPQSIIVLPQYTIGFQSTYGSIDTDNAGNIVVTGTINGIRDVDPGPGIYNIGTNNANSLYVAKYTPGTLQFIFASTYFQGNNNIESRGELISVNNCDQIIIFGSHIYNSTQGTSSNNLYYLDLAKLDSVGNIIWSDSFNLSVAPIVYPIDLNTKINGQILLSTWIFSNNLTSKALINFWDNSSLAGCGCP